MAYGFEGSIGFSWASIRAARRRARSAALRAAGTEGEALVGEVRAGAFEEVGSSDFASEGERLSRDVNSSIWASMDSVRVVGWERVRLTMLRRARRSCFRLAGRSLPRSSRRDFARARRSFMVSLGRTGAGGSDSAGFGAGSDDGEDLVSDGEGASMDSFCFFMNWRVALRSFASLEAPVAYMTRSGSTWNMSPGLSWYPGYLIYDSPRLVEVMKSSRETQLPVSH